MAARVHRATMRGAYLVWEFVVPILALGMAAYAIISFEPHVQRTIRTEKVCTETNQAACRALFDRLMNNMSVRQRRELACGALWYLHGPVILRVRRDSACHPPDPPYRQHGG